MPDSLREFSDTSSTNHLQYTYIEDYIRTLNRKEVVRSYWDNDRFGLSLGLNQYNLKRRVASVAHYSGTLDTSNYYAYNHAIHYSYDIHGNVDTLVMDEPKLKCLGDSSLGFKVINYDYDLISGKVNKLEFNRGKPDQYFHKYTYDADNRLLEAFTSRNGSLWERDARYFYYLHGPLARVEVGESLVQGLDYVYSLHGWIKG